MSNGKFYYENILANQNVTAKNNIAWVADFTTLELFRDQKIHVFLCIDIHSNLVVADIISKKVITASTVVKTLEKAIKKRCNTVSDLKLIIHTDRGTQFSSKSYNNFVQKFNKIFIPSMARENTPTDNSVAERYMRTFKEHKVNGVTIEEKLSNAIALNFKFNSYRSYFNSYIKSLNIRPNKKSSLLIGPERYDKSSTMASMLMLEPIYPKAQSEHISEDPRLPDVKKYKSEKQKVMGFLAELAAQKAELVDKTPFDSFENQLAYGIIDKKLAEIYDLIQNNPDITKEYVNQALEPVQDSLEELHKKIDTLLTKNRVNREILPLRDPIDLNLFPLFFANAGTNYQRQRDLKQAQLRLAYTLLYHTGLRVNEIRQITKKEIEDAIKSSQISVIHHKTRQPYIHVLSITAVHNFKRLKPEMEIIFNKYQFKYLFGKYEPIHKKSLIRAINEDLKNTCELNQIPFNIKSHSFRINMISSLLKNTSVQKAAQVIGHKNINSTMAYQRYAIQKDEIRILLDKIEGNQ